MLNCGPADVTAAVSIVLDIGALMDKSTPAEEVPSPAKENGAGEMVTMSKVELQAMIDAAVAKATSANSLEFSAAVKKEIQKNRAQESLARLKETIRAQQKSRQAAEKARAERADNQAKADAEKKAKADAAIIARKKAIQDVFGNLGGGDVVYVIDSSGSMIDTFRHVGECLVDSIDSLVTAKRTSRFAIMFYSHKPPLLFEGGALLAATKVNQAKAKKFIENIIPVGRTDVIPSLKLAFAVLRDAQPAKEAALRGQTIVLLTDGIFPDNRAVMKLVGEESEKSPHVKIRTVLYGNKPPVAEAMMKEIAKLTGGIYRFCARED